MLRAGSCQDVDDQAEEGGAPIPLFLAHKNLKPYAERHLGGVHFEPLKYLTLKGSTAHGIKAELIPMVCDVWGLNVRVHGETPEPTDTSLATMEVALAGLPTPPSCDIPDSVKSRWGQTEDP